MEKPSTLGIFVRQLREQKGYSIAYLASRCCCSPAYVRKIEADRVKSPGGKIMFFLANTLGISVEEFETFFISNEERQLDVRIAEIHNRYPNLTVGDLFNAYAKKKSKLSLGFKRTFLEVIQNLCHPIGQQ